MISDQWSILPFRHPRNILATVTIIIAYMVIAGYQFKGGGRFISILSEGAISPQAGMLLAAALIVGFTVLAGMVSIVSIDLFNGSIMLLAMVISLPFAITSHGSISDVVLTIQQSAPQQLSVSGGHDFFWVIGIALVGLAIYTEDPRFFLADGSVNRAMAEEVILRMGYKQLPVMVGSLLLAAGAAIVISTGNTFLIVTSTNVTRDIFQPLFFRDASSSQLVWVQRGCIIVIGVLAYLLMSQFETILEMALVSYTMIGASLAPALMAAFFWKRVTRIGGVTSIASGMLTVIGIVILNTMVKNSTGEAQLLGFSLPVDTDYIALPAVVVSVLTLVVVSLLTKRPDEKDWAGFIES